WTCCGSGGGCGVWTNGRPGLRSGRQVGSAPRGAGGEGGGVARLGGARLGGGRGAPPGEGRRGRGAGGGEAARGGGRRGGGRGGEEEAWRALVARYGGNPLALKVAGQTIVELFGGEIAAFLAYVTAIRGAVLGNIRRLLDAQLERLSDLERTLLYWLAVERE